VHWSGATSGGLSCDTQERRQVQLWPHNDKTDFLFVILRSGSGHVFRAACPKEVSVGLSGTANHLQNLQHTQEGVV
jgi:hypothetical protein